MAYAGTFIYVMRYGSLFQYVFCFSEEGDLHQDHVTVSAPLWRKVLFSIGILDNIYTTETIEEVEKILLSGAMKSLDELASRKATLTGTSGA